MTLQLFELTCKNSIEDLVSFIIGQNLNIVS